MEDVEVRVHKSLVGGIERDGLFQILATNEKNGFWGKTHMSIRGITTESFTHLGVHLLVGTDTISWMSIECSPQASFVKLFEEFDVIGEKFVVPLNRVNAYQREGESLQTVQPVHPAP